MNTVEGIQTLPNQLLLFVMLRELLSLKTSFKLHLITAEKKMMNMYKYELLKTEACSIRNII
jgi:hypothetical protein